MLPYFSAYRPSYYIRPKFGADTTPSPPSTVKTDLAVQEESKSARKRLDELLAAGTITSADYERLTGSLTGLEKYSNKNKNKARDLETLFIKYDSEADALEKKVDDLSKRAGELASQNKALAQGKKQVLAPQPKPPLHRQLLDKSAASKSSKP